MGAYFDAIKEEATKVIGQLQIDAALRACKQGQLLFGNAENLLSDLPALAAHLKQINPEISDQQVVKHAIELKVKKISEARQREMQTAIMQSASPGDLPELVRVTHENLKIPSLLRYGGEWPLRGNHPGLTQRLEKLFSIITGNTPIFDHKFLWMTKGEVLRKLVSYGAHNDWKKTHSCPRLSHMFPVPKGNMNCGVCSNCLLRRVAVHSAGLSDQDGPYVWQNLDCEDFDMALLPEAKKGSSKNDRSYAWLAIQDHVLLANPEILDSAAFKIETYEIAQVLGISVSLEFRVKPLPKRRFSPALFPCLTP